MELNDNPRLNFDKNVNSGQNYDQQVIPQQNKESISYEFQMIPKINRLAIISFIFGVTQITLFWLFFLAIPTIVFGHIAFTQAKLRNQPGVGLALAAIILGYMGGLFDLVIIGSIITKNSTIY